ncbi:MAG: hypothetical protein PQJ47_01955 [Sphaerochaetaceae bacterium]|nr:hypothetical protein [Sphaerochaetaceae bacterium]
MRKEVVITITLFKLPDEKEWENAFSPFSVVWDNFSGEAEHTCSGSLLDETSAPVADAHLDKTGKILKLDVHEGHQQQAEQFLSVQAFQDCCMGEASRFALSRIKMLESAVSDIETVEQIKNFRDAVGAIRTLLPLMTIGSGKKKRSEWKKRLKKIEKVSSDILDAYALEALYKEYNLEPTGNKTIEENTSILKEEIDGHFYEDLRGLVYGSTFSIAQLSADTLVRKQQNKFCESLHMVHSANDISAIHHVLKETARLIYLQQMAKHEASSQYLEVHSCLRRWHTLVLFQDLILSSDSPSTKQLQAVVKVDLEIEQLLERFRKTSAEEWEVCR